MPMASEADVPDVIIVFFAIVVLFLSSFVCFVLTLTEVVVPL